MRRRAKILIVALVIVLMIPNAVLLVANQHADNFTWTIALLAVPLGLLVGGFLLLGRKPWLACLLLAPFAALVPVVTFYALGYGTPITESLLGSLVTTNFEETSEFFGIGAWPLIVLTIASGLLALFAAWTSKRAGVQFGLSRLLRNVLSCMAAFLLLAFIGVQVLYRLQNAPGDRANHKSTSIRIARDFQKGYPFGIFVTLGAWWLEHSSMESAMARVDTFHFHARQARPIRQRQIYVLVIGESSRRNHWQLFGYRRATNPELSRIDHLVPITHMISAWPLTIGAVPDMITRKPASMPLTDIYDETSIVGLMRDAGFDTWWLSRQAPVGRWNSPIAVYANEAAHVRWLNFQKRGNATDTHDALLTDGLSHVLSTTHGNVFVVLHMMGSHRNYDLRYPSSFKHFTPTIGDGDRSNPNYRNVINSYDNTILYTDHVLASIIRLLQQTSAATALWYESDHGETLPTAMCTKRGHATGYRYEFPVPAFFWYSKAYARTFPSKVATIRANATRRTTNNDTFSSLADMADVDFPGHDQSRSLFSKTWRYRTRMIHPIWQANGDLVNYDDAALGDGCELVRARQRKQAPRKVVATQ